MAAVTTPISSVKRHGLPLLTFLMVLLVLGPFLHAHYGSSHLLGFHVDGIAQARDGHPPFGLVTVSQDGEEESAAVGVTTSHARQSLQDSEDEKMVDAVASMLVLFATAVHNIVYQWPSPTRPAHSPRTYALGSPPPAHGPPSLSL